MYRYRGPLVSHVELYWELPLNAYLLKRLASFSRVIHRRAPRRVRAIPRDAGDPLGRMRDGAGDGPFRFEPGGRRILKGFELPVALYAVARP
jgi:hypothetical protein